MITNMNITEFVTSQHLITNTNTTTTMYVFFYIIGIGWGEITRTATYYVSCTELTSFLSISRCFPDWDDICNNLDLNAHLPKPPPEEKEEKKEEKKEGEEKTEEKVR